MTTVFVTLSVLLLNLMSVFGSELARGYNDNIDWKNMEDGLKLAQEHDKPVMVLIHKSWCGACKALKPKFATDMEVEEFSQHFIMVNIQDDEEPKERQFTPDGGYIPRIVFMNSAGIVNPDIYNEDGNDKYKYFYPDTKHILKSMQKAKTVLNKKADEL